MDSRLQLTKGVHREQQTGYRIYQAMLTIDNDSAFLICSNSPFLFLFPDIHQVHACCRAGFKSIDF